MAFQSLFLVLLFCLLKRISTEQCETFIYEEPVTTFRIKNGSSQNCDFNGAKVLYSVIDSNSGEINFNITNATVCVGEYIFEVNSFNGTHTRQKFVICADTCNNNNVAPNANGLNFGAVYIFTGQYNVAIKSKNGTQIWESKVINLTTNYTQFKLQDVFDQQQPILDGNCDLIRNKNKLKVVIIANETLFPKPPGIELFVIPSDIVNYSIDGFCYKNYSKSCRSLTKYEHSCEYLLNESSGEYKIYTKIDDPRCNIKTLWTDTSMICVTWTMCKVKSSSQIPAPSTPTIGATQKIVIGSVVLVAIVAAVIFLSVKQLRIRASKRAASHQARYTRQTTNEESEYLIIYAREWEQFERVVDTLKRLLSCGNCSRVTTLYDLDPRCLNPRVWLENKLRDESVSVILLLNVAAPYACDPNFVYRISHCFDFLFPYAVQLLQSYEQRSYHNLYKVLTPEANSEAFIFVNTLTVYNLPQHTSELLSDLNITGEESKSFEELFKNECNAYHNCIVNSLQYLQGIFVKKIFL